MIDFILQFIAWCNSYPGFAIILIPLFFFSAIYLIVFVCDGIRQIKQDHEEK